MVPSKEENGRRPRPWLFVNLKTTTENPSRTPSQRTINCSMDRILFQQCYFGRQAKENLVKGIQLNEWEMAVLNGKQQAEVLQRLHDIFDRLVNVYQYGHASGQLAVLFSLYESWEVIMNSKRTGMIACWGCCKRTRKRHLARSS